MSPRQKVITVNDDQITIQNFIRHTLGCTCPADVLEQIKVQSNPSLSHLPGAFTEIHVGGRLLVYLWIPGSGGSIPDHLSVIIESGQKARDRMAYNRFRLVVGTISEDEMKDNFVSIFNSFIGTDDKSHLHIVHPEDIPDLSK
jgi:hypothetical protein